MKISILICTRNRLPLLLKALESIENAIKQAQPLNAEIIIVDNGSTDGTYQRVKEWMSHCSLPVHVAIEPKKGSGVARNHGITRASGEILVFTDDDCCLDKNYLVDLIKHHSNDKLPTLRGGKVELGDTTDLPLTIQTYPKIRKWHKTQNSTRNSHLGGGMILGCNMTMPKAIVEKVGFFDELIGAGALIPAGEDTDYVFRTYNAGFPVEYVPDMTAYHFHGRKDPEEARKLMRNYIIGAGALYAKHNIRHPNLRGKLKAMMAKVFKLQTSEENQGSIVPNTVRELSGMDYSKKDKLLLAAEGAWLYYKSFIRHLGKHTA